MRLLSGSLAGLSSRWSHGRADVSAGQLTFGAHLPPGIRVHNPFRKRITLDVVAVSPIGAHFPFSWWGPGPTTVSVTVTSHDAVIEIAVLATMAAWFVEAVAPPQRP